MLLLLLFSVTLLFLGKSLNYLPVTAAIVFNLVQLHQLRRVSFNLRCLFSDYIFHLSPKSSGQVHWSHFLHFTLTKTLWGRLSWKSVAGPRPHSRLHARMEISTLFAQILTQYSNPMLHWSLKKNEWDLLLSLCRQCLLPFKRGRSIPKYTYFNFNYNFNYKQNNNFSAIEYFKLEKFLIWAYYCQSSVTSLWHQCKTKQNMEHQELTWKTNCIVSK